MSTYCSRLQPALQNLLQHVVRFFHPRSSCMTTHISADVQSVTTWIMNSCCNTHGLCMTISGGRTEQLDIFCRVIGFTSDFLSFIVVELIRFFHGALHLIPAQRVFLCAKCTSCVTSGGSNMPAPCCGVHFVTYHFTNPGRWQRT